MNGIVAIGARGKVGMAVDEAGEDEVVREIDKRRACRDDKGGIFDGADAIAFKHEYDMGPVAAGAALKEVPGFDVGDGRSGCGRGESGRGNDGDEGMLVKETWHRIPWGDASVSCGEPIVADGGREARIG